MSSGRPASALTFTRRLVLLLALAAMPRPAMSAASEWSLADYVHTEWTHHDGVPLASLGSIFVDREDTVLEGPFY